MIIDRFFCGQNTLFCILKQIFSGGQSSFILSLHILCSSTMTSSICRAHLWTTYSQFYISSSQLSPSFILVCLLNNYRLNVQNDKLLLNIFFFPIYVLGTNQARSQSSNCLLPLNLPTLLDNPPHSLNFTVSQAVASSPVSLHSGLCLYHLKMLSQGNSHYIQLLVASPTHANR